MSLPMWGEWIEMCNLHKIVWVKPVSPHVGRVD